MTPLRKRMADSAPRLAPSPVRSLLRAGAAASILMIASPADARPTAVLINGATIYTPDPFTPLSLLANMLRAAGYRVVVTTHFTLCEDEEPVIVVGHSAGGAAALACAERLVVQVKYHPTVITLDAAPWWRGVWRCHVETCINIRTPGYPKISGAKDIPINTSSHVGLAWNETVHRIVLMHAQKLLR